MYRRPLGQLGQPDRKRQSRAVSGGGAEDLPHATGALPEYARRFGRALPATHSPTHQLADAAQSLPRACLRPTVARAPSAASKRRVCVSAPDARPLSGAAARPPGLPTTRKMSDKKQAAEAGLQAEAAAPTKADGAAGSDATAPPPVNYRALYRYCTPLDYCLLLIGLLGCAGSGVQRPASSIVMGNLLVVLATGARRNSQPPLAAHRLATRLTISRPPASSLPARPPQAFNSTNLLYLVRWQARPPARRLSSRALTRPHPPPPPPRLTPPPEGAGTPPLAAAVHLLLHPSRRRRPLRLPARLGVLPARGAAGRQAAAGAGRTPPATRALGHRRRLNAPRSSFPQEYLAALLRTEVGYYDTASQGALVSRLASDVAMVHSAIGLKAAVFAQNMCARAARPAPRGRHPSRLDPGARPSFVPGAPSSLASSSALLKGGS